MTARSVSGTRSQRFLLPLMLALATAISSPLFAQRAGIQLNTGEPIPKNYKSWSLFLVCNPSWLRTDEAAKARMKSLFDAFSAFSRTIGSDNLAVWPITRKTGGPEAYNADLAGDYCETYRLSANDSPHVVVTTAYPTKAGAPGDFSAISLNGLDTENMTKLLGTISDRVRTSDLDKQQLASDRFWRRWTQILQDSVTAMGHLAKAIKFTVDTKLMKLEFDGEKLSG